MARVATAVLATAAVVARAGVQIATNQDSVAGFGQLDGFTYPRMGGDGDGEVIFSGFSALGDSALMRWDAAGGGFVDDVNSSGAKAFSGFGDFAVSLGAHRGGEPLVVFVSSVDSEDGVFLQLPSGEVVTILTATTAFAPAGGNFTMLSQPSAAVSHDKLRAYVVFAARAGDWRGVIRAEVPLERPAGATPAVILSLVVDTSIGIPKTEVFFRCFFAPLAMADGGVIFFGSNCGSSESPRVQQQMDSQTPFRSHLRASHCLFKDREQGFGSSAVHPGIWRAGPGEEGLSAVAGDGVPVPGGSANETWFAFSNPTMTEDGTVAFVGLGSNNSYGIFKCRRWWEELRRVVDTETDIPGYAGVFYDFPNPPSLTRRGEVVFYGLQSSAVGGVFAETEGGDLATVLNFDDQVEGQGTIYLGFGPNACAGRRAAMYAVLANYTYGVWTFDVPNSGRNDTVAV